MRGIITIATGEKRYIEMAKMLALSLLQTNPEIKRAIISDVSANEFKDLFDIYIPYNKEFGKGINQKLHLDKYTPFEETFFIDADCLVFNSLDATIALCSKFQFAVFGDQISSGEWYMDIAEMCNKFSLPSIPLFNGGTYFFNSTAVTTKIFKKARELAENYLSLGFKEFRGSINEEPLIAVAMAINHIEAVEDDGLGMRTPIGLRGPLNVDILNKKCFFNKQGIMVQPVILHFAGAYSNAFHYKREVLKLRLIHKFPFLNKKGCSFIVNSIFNITYGSFVFVKRIAKVIIRKEKFDFKNVLPAFSNE